LLGMDTESLQNAGLSANETKVYLVLLHMDGALIGEIAQRSNIHRRNVYDALSRLVARGLVSYQLKSRKKYYAAENPNKLLEILKEKEQGILSMLPKLQAIRKEAVKPTVRILEGKEGVKEIYEDILETLKMGEEYQVFGVTGRAYAMLGPWYARYLARRRGKGIRTKAIFNHDVKGSDAARLPLASVRFLPKNFKSLAATFIYGNKVAQMIWEDEPPPSISIIVENERIARTYADYFRWMWKISEK
jgi:HTH-type transcriptional regulator, sugar sensing transcriptional regulator